MRSSPRGETALYWAVLATLAVFFVAMASWTPTQLDDWYEVDWLRGHPFSLATILEFARYNYVNYNPRIGETLLLVVNGPSLVHCILTPAFELLLPVLVFVLAYGRWPRARDLATVIVIQALLWLVIPIPGPIYFYRPFTANYLFASSLQLLLFVPYRLELARPPGPRRWWLAPVLLAWGVIAGMANEHTGPTAIVAAIAFCAWAWRYARLRAWMVCGAIGIAIGYAMLLLAPGQAVRYAGVAAGNHPFHTMVDRGIAGNLKFIGDYVVEIGPGLLLVIATMLYAIRRRGAEVAAKLDRASALRMALAIAAALAIVVTTFASPIVEDRLFFAPCLVTVIGLAIAIAVPFAESRARVVLIGASIAVIAIHIVGFVAVYRDLADQTAHRMDTLAAAPPDATVTVEPTEAWGRDHWRYGEDLQNAYMREMIAHHIYRVAGLELAPLPSWAQPNPPETTRIALDYDPPIAVPLPGSLAVHVPVQAAWVMRELRESWAELTTIAGHTLRAIDVTVVSASPLPGNRPIHLVTWRDGAFSAIDAHPRSDALGWPYAWTDVRRMPITPTEVYVQACGTTERGTMMIEGHELRIPLRYRCAGDHTIYVCDATQCWLAWRFW